MQPKEIFYYAIFTVSVAAVVHVRADNQSRELSEKYTEKRISKREAAIFVIDSFPGEPVTSNKPKRFYKRISKQKSKPTYVPPRGKPGSASKSITKKPYKKYKVKKIKPYSSPSAKKHMPKHSPSSFGTSKARRLPYVSKRPSKHTAKVPFSRPRPQRKPSVVYSPTEQEPMGFAEPPADYRPIKPQEIPVDSYGAPLKSYINDQVPKDSTDPYENYDIPDANTGPDYGNWNDQPQKDSNIEFSNNYQTFAHPSVFAKDPIADELNMNNYVPSNFDDMVTKNRKRLFFTDMLKLKNKPWRKPMDEEDKVLVGGQYAEPPGRYVPMYHSNDNIFFDDHERFIAGEIDTDTTATVSPYVNYKNSNMAFSPQNLNDAFSMDK